MLFRYFIFLVLISAGAYAQDSLVSFPGYPKWLLSSGDTAQQTSGIVFIGRDSNDARHFLLADDIGAVHRLVIFPNESFFLKKLAFSKEFNDKIAGFPKKDFEEILFDRFTGKLYISVEGNKPLTKQVAGIYEITLNKDLFSADSVLTINKLLVKPEDKFLQYTADNIGFEGITADSNYFYFALEGFSENTFFSDSTLIYVVGKKDLQIKNVVSTKKEGIHTISGLYSDRNYSLYGVDRNQKLFFHLVLDKHLKVKSASKTALHTNIPNYKSFDYVVSFESLTMDDAGGIYIVDDPWKTFYIPSNDILLKLDEQTVRNFKAFVPAIYKFKFY